MKKLTYAFVATLALLYPTSITPSVSDQWLKQANTVQQLAASDGMEVDLHVVSANGKNFGPAATAYLTKKDGGKACGFFLIVENSPNVDIVLSGTAKEDRDDLIYSILVHELGHCSQYYTHAELIPADINKSRDRRNEGYADVYALVTIAQQKPYFYSKAVNFFRKIRKNAGRMFMDDERYDTIEYLDQAKKILRLAATHRADDIANFIVYKMPLPNDQS